MLTPKSPLPRGYACKITSSHHQNLQSISKPLSFANPNSGSLLNLPQRLAFSSNHLPLSLKLKLLPSPNRIPQPPSPSGLQRTDSCSVCCLEIALNKVLLVGTKTTTYVGKPVVVTNVVVHVVVEEQPNTRIRITGITGFENYPGATLESVAASSST
ncbi:hypothetical protein LINGRAHAP2_LOCUS16278 [Linum grandiflorum]